MNYKRIPISTLKILCIILISISGLSCQQHHKEVVIFGQFPSVANATVSFSKQDDSGDPVQVVNIKNNRFSIKTNQLKTGFYHINISWPNPHPDTTFTRGSRKRFINGSIITTINLYIEPDKANEYEILLTNKSSPTDLLKDITNKNAFSNISAKVKSASVNGQLYDFFNNKHKAYNIAHQKLRDSLSHLADLALAKDDMVNYTALTNQATSVWAKELLPKMLVEYRENYYKNLSSVIVPYLISQTTDLQEHYQEYTDILNKLSGEAAESDYTKASYKRLEAFKVTGLKQKLPNPVGHLPNGQEFIYQPNQSKYTLIEFWASWCGPCRATNPDLLKIYSEFKDKGFNVIGVSIDTDKSKWLDAIKEDKLTWTNVSDLKNMANSDNTSRFNVVEIPQNFLVDHEGKIVAINIYEDNLQNKLKNLLSK
ncbi:TlpA family protein disulfide reductase [Pedobacter caeni]|uniref:Thiol-disulfide isomerase or thioredoxin n=1 Tax=Pedobacter caeni TaxID=288992 RepID=A0A1M4ZVZ4_9SPHI|nr:TlpA disulfide reductase family protein [Pedobacter caeni]SHF21766.1 Thiol-disulfide isomerase or thioredoxin [Pedobacter caeni]